jgi:predicted dithiol-disulfide oxidoreductase (DUF899 family)
MPRRGWPGAATKWRQRQELPWVRIDKEYKLATVDGSASLADLFRGRSQLLVYHFMFGPRTRRAVRPVRLSRTAQRFIAISPTTM